MCEKIQRNISNSDKEEINVNKDSFEDDEKDDLAKAETEKRKPEPVDDHKMCLNVYLIPGFGTNK